MISAARTIISALHPATSSPLLYVLSNAILRSAADQLFMIAIAFLAYASSPP